MEQRPESWGGWSWWGRSWGVGKQMLVRVKLGSSFHKGRYYRPMFLNYRSLNQSRMGFTEGWIPVRFYAEW